jgi:DNA-directed RNA polymerase specialized sigma24 family protein
MTTTLPSPERLSASQRVHALLPGLIARHHLRLLSFAERRCAGRSHLAAEWVNEAYGDALDGRAAEVAELAEDEILDWLRRRIRSSARRERRRRVHPGNPIPTEPAEFEELVDEEPSPQELLEEREELAAYREAFFALSDSRQTEALLMLGAERDRDEMVRALGCKDRAELRLLLHRAKARVAQRAAPIADGRACIAFQEQMAAAIEGALSARERAALERHMASGACGCLRVYHRLELDERRGHLRAVVPPVLLLPAAGGVADAGLTEAGLHGLLGLSRLTYLNEMAGIHQVAAWLGSLGSWAARPWPALAAMALSVPMGARRGRVRWLAIALGAVAALFVVGGMLHGFPGEPSAVKPASPAALAAAAAGLPPEKVALAAGQGPPDVRASALQVRTGLTRNSTRIASAARLGVSPAPRTRPAAWHTTEASYRASTPTYRRVASASASPRARLAPLSLDDAFTPGAGG